MGAIHDWQRHKLNVKPGAVCLWHVRGQPRDLDEWVKLDLEYIENWSLPLDVIDPRSGLLVHHLG